MEVIADTLKQALTGGAAHVKPSIILCDKVETLEIQVHEESQLFGKKVFYNFKYRLPFAEMPRNEYVDMRFGEIEKDLAELINEKTKSIEAKFVIDHNNNVVVEEDGRVIEHQSRKCLWLSDEYRIRGGDAWNTTPVDFQMENEQAFRARFQMMSHTIDHVMFGIVSSSFNAYTGDPSTDSVPHRWFLHFNGGTHGGFYTHSGSSTKFSGGPAPFAGSIVTVEFFPQSGIIQYLVNDVPTGRQYNCAFNDNTFGFAVAHYTDQTRIKLLSIKPIGGQF